MSTRAVIGLQKNDGSVVDIYCHFDGYPEHTGELLKSYYNSRERVEKLIQLGSIKWLGEYLPKIDDNGNYVSSIDDSITIPFETCVNGDKIIESHHNSSIFYHSNKDVDYIYLYTLSNEWLKNREIKELKGGM